MKKLASFGQETPKQTMKTPATQQSTELDRAITSWKTQNQKLLA